jgi:hypothetical protein
MRVHNLLMRSLLRSWWLHCVWTCYLSPVNRTPMEDPTVTHTLIIDRRDRESMSDRCIFSSDHQQCVRTRLTRRETKVRPEAWGASLQYDRMSLDMGRGSPERRRVTLQLNLMVNDYIEECWVIVGEMHHVQNMWPITWNARDSSSSCLHPEPNISEEHSIVKCKPIERTIVRSIFRYGP